VDGIAVEPGEIVCLESQGLGDPSVK